METVEAGAVLRSQGICTHTFDIVRTGHAVEFISADEHLKAVQRIAELEAALTNAVVVLRTYDLTATADRCEHALKGKGLNDA